MDQIYNIRRDVESAKKRLKNLALSDEVKDKILEFVNTLTEGSGIKEHRQYYYYERLLILSEVLGDKILNPSKTEVLKAISELRDRTTVRHTPYSPATISDFKKTLKKFVKYANGGNIPKFWTDDIHAEKIGSRYKRPDQMITYDELQELLKACRNIRDKAMISLLWDSGIRASELLKLQIEDFKKSIDGLYAVLTVKEGSKGTGYGTVVLTGDSVVLVPQYIDYLKDFLKDKFTETGFLFIGIGKEKPGVNLSYEDLRSIIKKVKNRSTVNKNISPHLFRHSAATRMAVDVPIQVFTKQMGWSSNKMADNYTHMDSKGQIMAILKSQGIPITDEELSKPLSKVNRKCPRCHVTNTGGSRFCSNCGSPLKPEDFVKVEEQRLKVVESMKESNLISSEIQNTMDIMPEDSKLDLLATLLIKLEKEGKLDDIKKRIKKD